MSLASHGELPDVEEAIAHLFFDAEDDAVVQFGDTWLEEASLLSAACPAGTGVALGRGSRLWVAPLSSSTAAAHWALPPGSRVTSLAWLACAVTQGGAHDSAVLLGTSQGRLLLFTPTGALIHSQKVFDAPATSLACSSGDVCVASCDAVALLPVFELQALLRAHAMHSQRGLQPEAWTHEPLNLTTWDLRRAGCVGISHALVIGPAQQQLHDTLAWAGAGRGRHTHSTRLVTAAEVPSFGLWLGPDAETSVLAAVGTLAVTAVSAVGGAMLSLLSPWGSRAAEREAAAAGPPPRRSASAGADAVDDEEEEQRRVKPITAARHHGLYDPPRVGLSLALCYPLAAGADALGRVLLLDVAAPGGGMCVRRVFKGHRGAQIAWVSCGGDGKSTGTDACRLVIFTPGRNGQLEVWRPLAGVRTARLRVGRNCRLLAAWPVFGASDDRGGAASCSGAVFLVHGATGELSKLTGVWESSDDA